MEKLELKHLAPYLPYGLKLHYEGSSIIKDLVIAPQQNFTSCPISTVLQLDYVKPILRPLSDLSLFYNKHLDGCFGCGYIKSFIDNPQGDFNVHAVSYGSVEKLYQLHFDVFNLIGRGLAVDVNTIKP